MANATKIIVLPEAWMPNPGVARWITGLIQINHPLSYASVEIIAANADGSIVEGAGAYRTSFTVNGASYLALFGSPTGQTLAAGLVDLIVAGGQAAERPELTGATVEDVGQ